MAQLRRVRLKQGVPISTTSPDNTIRPPPLQSFYNSGTTGPIETKMQPFESDDTISSAVLKMVTSGDLGDLQRSTLRFRLLQPFYNSGTTGLIETKMPPVVSVYAISSSVLKVVTSGDSVTSKGQLYVFAYSSHSITQKLLGRSRRKCHQSIQSMRFHQLFRRW